MTLSAREFDDLVNDCMDVVPARFRRRLENVVLVVELEPPQPGLLGLFEGRPAIERSFAESFVPPARITIYQGPHERQSRNRAELRKLVRETIWHEVAHYFGLDERRVLLAEKRRQRILGRRRQNDL